MCMDMDMDVDMDMDIDTDIYMGYFHVLVNVHFMLIFMQNKHTVNLNIF
jgi:hypothetical protein